jgi:ATP-dependent exoDNAse (exonuclease V) beta subunit
MAVRLLEEDPEFRRSWKENYRFIMIDEFQDNNDLQRKLLYLLAEYPERDEEGIPDADELVPGKLFFVGDEKQSIYRFRGADVGVFKRLSREIAAAGGQAIDLPRNYRSEPVLIDFFNRFFPGIFADAREDYEAGFQPLKSRDASEGVVPKIGFFYRAYNPLKDESLLSDAESEAWYIARRIKEMVEGGDLPLPGGGTASYGDIALLMRSSSNQINFESSFRRLGIPYTVQSARALFLEAPVSDFYQILQLALYPEDRLAYLGLLRSPFAGLSDDVISELMLREREEHAEPFSSDPDDPLFDGEGERYRLAGEAWRMVCGCADREPLAEIVRRLWHSFGYRYAVLRNPDYHVYLEYYDYLYEFALRADRQGETLVTFLVFLRENLGKYEKIEEVEPPREESLGVRIMSIHKSKGLQFPVVFVAGCGTTGRREGEGESPFFADPELGITLAAPSTGRKSGKANFFYRRGQELEKEQEVAEMKRLLYVAATRAEHHLFFSGYHGRNNRNMDGLGRFSFLNWIGAGFGAGSGDWEDDPAFDGIMEIIPPIEAAERDRASDGTEGKRILEEAGRTYAAAGSLAFDYPQSSFSPSSLGRGFVSSREVPAEPAAKSAAESGELPVDRYLKGEDRITAFGTLCHRMVEEGIKRGGAEESVTLPPQFSSLSSAAAALVMDTARGFARFFLDSEMGMRARRESAAGSEVAEVAFVYRTGKGRFIDGSIDLLLEGEDGEEALVFDFKSDRGMEPEHHLPQLAIYRQAAEALTGKRVRTFLWYLRRGEAVELDTASAALSEILDADALIDSSGAAGSGAV